MSRFDELPEGWIKTNFGDVVHLIRGITFPSSEKLEQPTDDSVICLRTSNVQEELEIDDVLYIPRKFLKRDDQWVKAGDIVISMANSYELVGKVARAKEELPNTTIGGFISIIRPLLGEPDYFFYLLRSRYMQYAMRRTSSRTVNIANISLRGLQPIEVPLPPVNEQRRIVEKIEALTARSRKARAALDEIPALLDQFRQSVLAAAFRGDLTADWRAQNPNVEPAEVILERIRVDLDRRKDPKKITASTLFDIPEKWSWVSLEAISTHKSGVAFKSKDFIQEGVQVIRLGNVYKGKLDLGRDPVFLPSLCLEENFNLVPGCIVVSQTGTRFKKDYGNFVLIPSHSSKLLLNQRLLAVYCHSSIDPEYVVFASKLETYKNHFFASETGGVNQGNVGVSGVMEGPIPLAPVEERKEIIQKIKDSFSAIDLLEELLIENQHELGQLDQSILAKAFRGELVPQDPNDEPAAVLLDRIRAERERLGSGKKRGKAKA